MVANLQSRSNNGLTNDRSDRERGPRIRKLRDGEAAWMTDMNSSADFHVGARALITSIAVPWDEGVTLPVEGQTLRSDKDLTAANKALEKAIADADELTEWEKSKLAKHGGDYIYVNDKQKMHQENAAQIKMRRWFMADTRDSLAGSWAEGLLEDEDDFAPLDFARLWRHIVEVIEQDRLLELGTMCRKLFSLTYRNGDNVASYASSVNKIAKEMKELHTDAVIPDVILLSVMLSMTYGDPLLQKLTLELGKKPGVTRQEIIKEFQSLQSRDGKHRLTVTEHQKIRDNSRSKAFATRAEDGRIPFEDLDKSLCFQWQSKGECSRGDDCKWPHGKASKKQKLNPSTKDQKRPKCDLCHTPGHLAKDCRTGTKAGKTPTKRKYKQPAKTPTRTPTRANSAKRTRNCAYATWITEEDEPQSTVAFKASVAASCPPPTKVRTMIDSGSQVPLTFEASDLTSDVRPANAQLFGVLNPNGGTSGMKIDTKGTMDLSVGGFRIPHTGTLQHSGIAEKISSVSQLNKNGLSCIFHKGDLIMIEADKLSFQGPELLRQGADPEDGLWYAEWDVVPKSQGATANATKVHDEPNLLPGIRPRKGVTFAPSPTPTSLASEYPIEFPSDEDTDSADDAEVHVAEVAESSAGDSMNTKLDAKANPFQPATVFPVSNNQLRPPMMQLTRSANEFPSRNSKLSEFPCPRNSKLSEFPEANSHQKSKKVDTSIPPNRPVATVVTHKATTNLALEAKVATALEDYLARDAALFKEIFKGQQTITQGFAALARCYRGDLGDYTLWHARLGHRGPRSVKGVKPNLKVPPSSDCDACAQAKIHAGSFPKNDQSEYESWLPGERVDADYKSGFVETPGGCTGRFIYVDRATSYIWAPAVRNQLTQTDELEEVVVDSKSMSGRDLRMFKCDGAGCFMDGETTLYLKGIKAKRKVSAPYCSQQNQTPEVWNKSLDEGSTAQMIHAGNAPSNMWAESQACWVFVHNRAFLVEEQHEGKPRRTSRYNLMTNRHRPFREETLHAWGCRIYAYIPKKIRKGKGAQKRKCHLAIFVGYSLDGEMFRCQIIGSRVVVEVAIQYCIVHEHVFPWVTVPRTTHEISLPPHFFTYENEEDDDWRAMGHLMDPEVDVDFRSFNPDSVSEKKHSGERVPRVGNSPSEEPGSRFSQRERKMSQEAINAKNARVPDIRSAIATSSNSTETGNSLN
jgi:hypothetical protein